MSRPHLWRPHFKITLYPYNYDTLLEKYVRTILALYSYIGIVLYITRCMGNPTVGFPFLDFSPDHNRDQQPLAGRSVVSVSSNHSHQPQSHGYRVYTMLGPSEIFASLKNKFESSIRNVGVLLCIYNHNRCYSSPCTVHACRSGSRAVCCSFFAFERLNLSEILARSR